MDELRLAGYDEPSACLIVGRSLLLKPSMSVIEGVLRSADEGAVDRAVELPKHLVVLILGRAVEPGLKLHLIL